MLSFFVVISIPLSNNEEDASYLYKMHLTATFLVI